MSTVAGFHLPVFHKRGQGRTKPSSVTGQDSSSRPVRVRRSQRTSSVALLRLLFCGQHQLFFPVFLRSFTKASKALFASVKAGSEIMENGLLCGGEQRKRSVAALGFCGWTLVIRATFLPCRCVNTSKKRSVLLLTFLLLALKMWCHQD